MESDLPATLYGLPVVVSANLPPKPSVVLAAPWGEMVELSYDDTGCMTMRTLETLPDHIVGGQDG